MELFALPIIYMEASIFQLLNAHLMSTAHQQWQQFGKSEDESSAAIVTAAPHFRSWCWKQFIVKSLLAKQHHR